MRTTLVELCCGEEVAADFKKGDKDFEQVRPEINLYATSLHMIASCLKKLGQIQQAGKLYRGPGGLLPKEFFTPDIRSGACGGAECAFLSATTEKEVAVGYASNSKSKVLLEINQAYVDRGADLSWLSQYPFEAEVTFPPLTLFEKVVEEGEGEGGGSKAGVRLENMVDEKGILQLVQVVELSARLAEVPNFELQTLKAPAPATSITTPWLPAKPRMMIPTDLPPSPATSTLRLPDESSVMIPAESLARVRSKLAEFASVEYIGLVLPELEQEVLLAKPHADPEDVKAVDADLRVAARVQAMALLVDAMQQSLLAMEADEFKQLVDKAVAAGVKEVELGGARIRLDQLHQIESGYKKGEACPFIFLLAAKLRVSSDVKSLPTLQALRRERPDWLCEHVLTLQGAVSASFLESTLAVSHRWETKNNPEHPDTEGVQFDAIRSHLIAHEKIEYVWFECVCRIQPLSPAAPLVWRI